MLYIATFLCLCLYLAVPNTPLICDVWCIILSFLSVQEIDSRIKRVSSFFFRIIKEVNVYKRMFSLPHLKSFNYTRLPSTSPSNSDPSHVRVHFWEYLWEYCFIHEPRKTTPFPPILIEFPNRSCHEETFLNWDHPQLENLHISLNPDDFWSHRSYPLHLLSEIPLSLP